MDGEHENSFGRNLFHGVLAAVILGAIALGFTASMGAIDWTWVLWSGVAGFVVGFFFGPDVLRVGLEFFD